MTSTQIRSILLCVVLTGIPVFAQESTKPAEIKPTEADTPKIELPKPPTPEEIEAKRLADEAEAKRREEAARLKAEAEKSFFTKLIENSKLYTGVMGGIGVGINKAHGTGYTLGMNIDYLAYKTWGFHFAAETGQYPAKSGTLSSSGGMVNISSGGSFGFLALDFAAVYAFPKVFHLDPAVGLGISLYQLRGGAYDFNQTIAPLLYGSLYYDLFSHLQLGFITQLTLPSSSKIESTGTSLALDNNASLTTVAFKLALRYAWF